jgi:hypothetical protein
VTITKKRRRLLTDRMLEGMLEALSLVEAGGPGDLTGIDDDDPESIRLHLAACDAWRWVQDEIEARKQARKKKRQIVLTPARGK